DKKCEKCGKPFALRKGPRGHFLACSGYPKCRNIISVKEEEAKRLIEKFQPPQDKKQA
ncbi:MAG: topoisomerase DNA-binding C4 zinc finger domain-containing protein, partial [Elusimicrobia bacterium]|nr:topoisomerase DNA-binding C4 zinc finger domain-containing protein [Elusimicrobiota bacterium]